MTKKKKSIRNSAFRAALGEDAYEAYREHLRQAGAKGGKAKVPKGFAISHKQKNKYQLAAERVERATRLAERRAQNAATVNN